MCAPAAVRFLAIPLLVLGLGSSALSKCLPEPSHKDSEAKVLKHAKGRASRNGTTLRLATEAGPVDFSDLSCENYPASECMEYSLAAALPQHRLWVVYVGYYEGNSYKLVDMKTGKTTQIDGFPHFSPDGRKFVTTTNDSHSGIYTLGIWKSRPDGYDLEWGYNYSKELPADDWSYCVDSWIGPEQIVLQGQGWKTVGGRQNIVVGGRGWLRYDGTTWRYKPATRLRPI